MEIHYKTNVASGDSVTAKPELHVRIVECGRSTSQRFADRAAALHEMFKQTKLDVDLVIQYTVWL